jgi:peptide/nickel transport system substrate-binding protein
MKTKLLPMMLVAALALILATALACGSDDEDETQAPAATFTPLAVAQASPVAVPTVYAGDIKRGGTFILGTPQQITTLDGHGAGPANNSNAKEGLLGTATRFGFDGLVGPHLWSSWEASSDLTSYTFTVQQGVKWHNGRDLEAEDFTISTRRAVDISSPFANLYKEITSIETIDASTNRVTFPVANGIVPDSFYSTYVVARENIKDEQGGIAGAEDDFSIPIGTGPFTFGEWIAGEKVVMDRFEDYWQMGEDGKSLPYLDRVIVRTIPDATSLLASLKTGEVHFYWQFPPRLFGALQFDKNADAVISSFSVTHFYFTMEHSRTTGDNVFGDVKARRALLLAIDKQEIVDAGYGGTARPILTNQFIPSNFPLGPKGFPEIERDVEEAKRLFAELGVDELHFVAWDAPAWTPISEVLQSQLAEAGVKLTIEINRVADWSCALGRGDCGPDWGHNNTFSANGALSPPDPNLHIAGAWMCPGTDTTGKFCNEEMDEIARLATQTTDVEERKRLYKEWNQIFIDVIPNISYAQLPFYHGNYKTLKGVVNLFGMPFYEAAWLDE